MKIRVSTSFKKDLKTAKKRGLDLEKLKYVINELSSGNTLSEKYRDHALSGNWKGYRECHVEPDWLLVYQVDASFLYLYLVRTGTYSDLIF